MNDTLCPNCGTPNSLEYVDLISTWTIKRYICRVCKKGVTAKTSLGKAVEIAPFVMAASIAIRLLDDPFNIDINDIADLF